jgi:hypothetical protein
MAAECSQEHRRETGMSDTLSFVRDYLPDAVLLDEEARSSVTFALPPMWDDILSVEGNSRVARALGVWDRFEENLPELVEKLRDRLISIDLLRYRGDRLSLLYGLQGKQRVLYYEAKNPLQRRMRPNVSALWDRLPSSVQEFYSVQDGWFYLASHSMGPSPAAEAFVLADEDWDILERIEPPPVDLSQSIALFTNGMSGYVCIDVSRAEAQAGFLWWSNKAPKFSLDFWSVVDAWASLGLEEDRA